MANSFPKIKCAIYTRKSSEEGLEQEFNSLDAQRVAAEAYIQSQVHEGWHILPEHYDDGGYSGGNLKRPALEKLIQDIESGKIDTVVVYKVDRLSRSLHDFAKLVELFDKHNVTFVSVTQAFNTTNSMGRLTLNILLSFAQFEREVTGERIRDKFAASKKKGIWMGGPVPLGYDVNERKLIINKAEAEQVQHIFETYLKAGSVSKLVKQLNQQGMLSKKGKLYTRNSVRTILSNVLYLGKVSHKNELYEGEQEGILEQGLWDKVQKRLSENTVNESGKKNETHEFLLKGKVYDAQGNVYTSTYTKKATKRYYYYLNKSTADRISMKALHDFVWQALEAGEFLKEALSINGLTREEVKTRYKANLLTIAQEAIQKVVLHGSHISIFIGIEKVKFMLEGQTGKAENNHSLYELKREIAFKSYAGKKSILLNGHQLISHKEADIKRHENMVRLISSSFKMHEKLQQAPTMNIKELAKAENIERTYLGDLLKLRYLCPEIVEAIFNGEAPLHLNASILMRTKVARNWQIQKEQLGFI